MSMDKLNINTFVCEEYDSANTSFVKIFDKIKLNDDYRATFNIVTLMNMPEDTRTYFFTYLCLVKPHFEDTNINQGYSKKSLYKMLDTIKIPDFLEKSSQSSRKIELPEYIIGCTNFTYIHKLQNYKLPSKGHYIIEIYSVEEELVESRKSDEEKKKLVQEIHGDAKRIISVYPFEAI
jgi:hypothetical protein